jgi:hypothetical protein
VVSQVKNQIIIEAIGDLFCSKHGVSMCQVNPNKASKEKTTIMLPYNKNNAWFFQRLIKQSQSFETIHATIKTTKHTIKNTSSTICKSLSRSLNKLPFLYHFLHKTFSLFQHHSNLFNSTLLMKTNMDQRSKYTLMQRYNKIWTKIKAKNES